MSDTPNVGTPAPSAPAPSREKERGSALIVSLMITVILTMLGVTFLVLSEQEEKISINSRDHSQTLYVAEAAVELAKTWFNDPSSSNNLKPSDIQMNLTLRRGATFKGPTVWGNSQERAAAITHTHSEVSGPGASYYTGGNAGGSGSAKFEKPYRGPHKYGFWGRQATPDVLLCGNLTLNADGLGGADCTTDMKTYMDNLNAAIRMGTLLRADGHSSRDLGTIEVEQIRVYRPPLDFNQQIRYGIATIEATAVKKVNNRVVSRRTVRDVLQEIPFPQPGGAIETDGAIGQAGSVGVHWGGVTSASADDDISLPGPNNNFPDAPVPRSTSGRWGYHFSINPAAFEDQDSGGAAGIVATALTELMGITKNGVSQANATSVEVGDPWLVFRARRNILISGEGTQSNVQPWPFGPAAMTTFVGNGNPPALNKGSVRNRSHLFQKQIVRFPPFDYDTWKKVSQSGQQGMHYLKWVAGETYKKDGSGPTRTFNAWLGLLPRGVFFFDTKDSSPPLADLSNLTPVNAWGNGTYVEGFIYLNSTTFDSGGSGTAPDKDVAAPGEVFLDDGIDLHVTGSTTIGGDDCICIRFDAEESKCVLGVRPIRHPECAGIATFRDGDDCRCPEAWLADEINDNADQRIVAAREAETFRNGVWDSDINNDGVSDAGSALSGLTGWARFIGDNAATSDNVALSGGRGYGTNHLPFYTTGRRTNQGAIAGAAGAGTGDWKRDPRFLNRLPDFGAAMANRQPHEPYLNFDSKTNGNTVGTWSVNDHAMKVNWKATGEVTLKDDANAPSEWTTVSRDARGALMRIGLHLNGVIYCEGQYTGNGNLKVYGSMLMKGGYTAGGSPEVWFNEDLVKGNFPDPKWKLPRVFTSGRDTQ